MKRIVPWLVLIVSAAVLVGLYPSFPERWPIHWNAAGQIDGWTDKSTLGAGFPLVMAMGLTIFLELLALLGGKCRNARLPEPWPQRLADANANYILYIATLLNLFFGYLACTLPFGPPPIASIFLLVTGAILYPVYDFMRLSREMHAAGALPKGYQGGIYRDASDPRLWVPKLSGAGWTLNFAHRRSRLILLLLVGLPIAISLLVIRSAAHP